MLRVISLLAIVCGVAGTVLSAPQPSDDDRIVEIRLPLDHGRLQVRDVLETICREAGVEPGDRFRSVDLTIDIGSTLGQLQMRLLERVVANSITTEVQAEQVVVRIDRRALASQSDKVLRRLERWMLDSTGWRTEPRRFGMSVVTRTDRRAPMDMVPEGTTRAVVLVHGLDDPGWTWRDLALRLLEQGYVTLRFEYPNDQPIADSADFFAVHLQGLHSIGIDRVDVVAHSMGGLVTRDVLTRKAYYGSDGSGRGGRFPAIDRLIMLGTPNHGTPVARLRGVIQLRGQFHRWLSGEWSLGDAIADGAGEAGRDLLPGSVFLRRLNIRPRPSHTIYTIVAGQISPLDDEEIEALAERIQKLSRSFGAPDSAPSDFTMSTLTGAIRGLGDGIVSIKSAELEGVNDVVIVPANHLSMIVNVFASDATPPAIPYVLERLAVTRP